MYLSGSSVVAPHLDHSPHTYFVASSVCDADQQLQAWHIVLLDALCTHSQCILRITVAQCAMYARSSIGWVHQAVLMSATHHVHG
jgi:hypothetical protein